MAISSAGGGPATGSASAPCAERAAFMLLDEAPRASAGRALAPPATLWLPLLAFAIGVAAVTPAITAGLLVAGLCLFVLAVSALRLAGALLAPCWSPRRAIGPDAPPRVTVIVALYQEAEVVAGLMTQLSRLRYPKDRLEIILVLEAEDAETLSAARAAARRAEPRTRVLAAPPAGPRTKPRALNYALQIASGELIAVYDAEDAPHGDQLIAAAEAFAADDRLGVVQAPLGWYNRPANWLTRQFALEYAAQFLALLPVFARLGLPLPLGGTSNVFRRSALEACGAWDPFNVTEDADLGFRLARGGWRAGLIAPGTDEEAPELVDAWLGQRSRWLKGHAVTWLVQMRDPRALARSAGWRAVATLQLSLLANVACAAGYPVGVALMALTALAAVFGEVSGLNLAALSAGLGAHLCAFACAAAGARRAGFRARLSDLASMPAYWLLQHPAAVRALHELRTRPYVWVKTRHGVSTARREAPDDLPRHAHDHGCDSGPVHLRGAARGTAQRSAAPAHGAVDAGGDHRRGVLHLAARPSVLPDGT